MPFHHAGMHMGMRGTWRIAMVIAAALGVSLNGPGNSKPKRKKRWYARALTPQDQENIDLFNEIMEKLREHRNE